MTILRQSAETNKYLARVNSDYGKPQCSESPFERLLRHVIATQTDYQREREARQQQRS